MLTIGHAHLMVMLHAGCVVVRLIGLGDRGRHQPVVIRAASEHGCCGVALEGQRDEQQPHHCGTKTGHHGESVEGFS